MAHITPHDPLFCNCTVYVKEKHREMKASPSGATAVYLGRDYKRGGDFVYISSRNVRCRAVIMNIEEDRKWFPSTRTSVKLKTQRLMAAITRAVKEMD